MKFIFIYHSIKLLFNYSAFFFSFYIYFNKKKRVKFHLLFIFDFSQKVKKVFI
jgi:hypothetical protein